MKQQGQIITAKGCAKLVLVTVLLAFSVPPLCFSQQKGDPWDPYKPSVQSGSPGESEIPSKGVSRCGSDACISRDVVEKIRSYSREQPVYIAYDGNGWCINPHNVAKKLIRDGANFRATGLATEDFNIFQLPDGKYPKDYENGINWLFLNKIKEYQWVKCDKPERTGCVIEAQ